MPVRDEGILETSRQNKGNKARKTAYILISMGIAAYYLVRSIRVMLQLDFDGDMLISHR